MMTDEQRSAAMAMLGQGTAAQAGNQLNPNLRQQQLGGAEQAALGMPGGAGLPPPPGMPPQQPPVNPGMLMQLLQMLRGR